MNRNLYRQVSNGLARVFVYGTALAALIPLGLVLAYTVSKGLPSVENVDFFINSFRPIGIPGGGVAHALAGTVIMVGLASLLAVPVGILSGVYLVEYGRGRWGDLIRLASDVLVGAPSIAIGLFAYALLVAPFHHFSGISAAVALAVLMLPVVIRTTEGAIELIPGSLREAGLALGLARWRVALQLIVPAAAPGIVTGALLAVARAAGETAPLLFTAFGNQILNLDPSKPMAALPLLVFNYARQPYPQAQQQAWGAALVLVVLVLITNLTSRFVFRRQIALASKL
ncbi:MAG: phosphate ABC transporter permease PstA [Chloroflexi bacterium]|nr:MAG: phosphate ABC transporter permease PstA [Chloroflexota bacterium]TME16143.1 MAG: phosphate ABC transporter permease PstA [Chloroflexota bacterium]